jgi:Beta-1,3-glucanase
MKRFLTFMLVIGFLLSMEMSLFGETGSSTEPFLPIKISNDSHIVGDNEVFFLAKGINPETGIECFLSFDKNGQGYCVDITEDTKSKDFSFLLSDYPVDDEGNQLRIPMLISGRLYVSLIRPMDLEIQNRNGILRIVDADGFKPRDANYYTLYDKIELTFVDAGSWVNPTAVDFFSLALRVEQEGSTSETTVAGLNRGREEIYEQLRDVIKTEDKTTNNEWDKLFLSFSDLKSDTTTLRFMSPGKAMAKNVEGAISFDDKYLNNKPVYGFNWTDFIWDYYETHSLRIDTSELRYIAPLPGDEYIFTGLVDGETGKWVFSTDAGYVVEIEKPETSVPFFAGAIYPFDATNNTPKAIIVRQLTSAFDVGLLPIEDGGVLDRDYLVSHMKDYFQPNSLLPVTEQGPWYDLYAKALHSFGDEEPIYSFAYDDALGQDGTLHDPNVSNMSQVRITLGDMSGTVIADPFLDDQVYSATILIGGDSEVIHNGKVLQYGEILEDITTPFKVTLNGEDAEVYFNPVMVRPQFPAADGILVKPEPGSPNKVTIIFPSKPKGSVQLSN